MAGMSEAASRVVLAGKKGSTEGEQQRSNSGPTAVGPPSVRAWQTQDGAPVCH